MKTGNSPELFGEMKRTDICTNPKCYAAKCDASFARLEQAATSEGKRLLSAEESNEVFEDDGSLMFDSRYEILSRQPDRAEMSTTVTKIPSWKKLLENVEAKPPIVVARDPRGRVVELVERSLAMEAINLAAKQKGEASIFAGSRVAQRKGSDSSSTWQAEQKKQRTLAKHRLAVALAAMTELVGAVDAKGAVKGFWNTMIETSIDHAGHDGCWLICKRLGLDPKAKNGHTTIEGVQGAALEYGLTLPDEKFKLGFLVELLISQATKFSTATYGGGLKSTRAFQRFAGLYKIDVDAIDKRVREEAKEKKKTTAKKKPGNPLKPEQEAPLGPYHLAKAVTLPGERQTYGVVQGAYVGEIAKPYAEHGLTKAQARDRLNQLNSRKQPLGQSDIKAPPIGAIEHKWDKSSGKLVGSEGNKEFVCKRCGAIGAQIGSAWPPVLEKRFLEKPCLPNEQPPNESKISKKKQKRVRITKLTPAARKKLVEAMKRRWAARRKDAAKKKGGEK